MAKLASVRLELQPTLKIKGTMFTLVDVPLLPPSQVPPNIYETELKL